MSQNKYYRSFKSKTDSELKEKLNNKEKYTSEAIEAAELVLNERLNLTETENNVKTEMEDKIFTETKNVKIKENVKTESFKKSYLTDDPSSPQLHSKRTIYVFSCLFSTIFGAVLMMYNLQQVKNKQAKYSVLAFGVLYNALIIFVIDYFNITRAGFIFNIVGASILTEYFWNSFIGKEFYYRKRSWIKPAIISVVISIPFILVMIYA